jgi:hypothetical protein
VQDCIRGLQALIDRLDTNKSSTIGVSGSFAASSHLPLSRSMSQDLADLVTIFVPRSTWWSTQEGSDWWALFGEIGAGSGPRVTVCITATSDKDVVSC